MQTVDFLIPLLLISNCLLFFIQQSNTNNSMSGYIWANIWKTPHQKPQLRALQGGKQTWQRTRECQRRRRACGDGWVWWWRWWGGAWRGPAVWCLPLSPSPATQAEFFSKSLNTDWCSNLGSFTKAFETRVLQDKNSCQGPRMRWKFLNLLHEQSSTSNCWTQIDVATWEV